MITDEDAKRLVASMREIAEENAVQAQRAQSKAWRAHCEGRTDAYRLAAGWLEKLIPDKEADGA